ncbi:glycine cleavage system protein GcvH [bacterium]|nr:glycine cleavage system protein GcvH [bacterium]
MAQVFDGYGYTKEHEWVKVEDGFAFIGITDYAQGELGEVVFAEFLKSEGDKIEKGDEFASLESTKSTSQVFSPVSGEVVAFNSKVEDDYEIINSDPFGDGWLIKIKLSDPSQIGQLMGATEYNDFLDTL